MNADVHAEANDIINSILKELPSSVPTAFQWDLKTLGKIVEKRHRLGEWATVEQLHELLGGEFKLSLEAGPISVAGLTKLLKEAMGEPIQVDVGPYRFSRELGNLDLDVLYSIARNPAYADYQSHLLRLFRLGAAFKQS